MYDAAIIGCGIVGAAIARELAKYRLSLCILEKENDIATGTTKANSAIIHSGYDPLPGTLMARLNVRGGQLIRELAKELHVEYRQIGSLTLAFSDDDSKTIRALYERGLKNGVPGLRILSADETLQMEPNLSEHVVCALYAPSAGILMPWRMAAALAESAVRNGAELHLNSEVCGIEKNGQGYLIRTQKGDFAARYVINAAGVHAGEIHNMAAPPAFKTLPSRGQYYLFDKNDGNTVNHVIFQCPTEQGKGVLVSPTIDGNLIVGPNAEDVQGDDRSTTAQGLAFVHQKAALSVPGLDFRDSIRNFAGVRAVTDIDDFIIEEPVKGFVDVAGIKSPGLSSAPAIAEYVTELLKSSGLRCEPNGAFLPGGPQRTVFRELSAQEKQEAIRRNPLYGRIICRCETISEGEIVDALHSPIPPSTLDGVKRRCGAGMGRCQGGFCGPRVHEIIARERKIPMEEIQLDGNGSWILAGKTKSGGGAL